MKRAVVLIIAVMFVALGAWAATEKVGDYTWVYCINGDTAEIYNHGCSPIWPIPTGSLTIPSTLGGKPVTSIGDGAFEGCRGLTSVTIPSSVTSIGRWAFSGCSGLTSVTIPDGVTSIGGDAFRGCSGLTSVTIPNSVTSIGEEAFYECSGLTSVTIPDSVTSIGDSAFRGCSGLTSVTIPDGVTSIGYEAFSDCSGLTSVTIPDSVTSIGEGAFAHCSGLTSMAVPNSVTSIGDWAFSGCSGLTSVTMPRRFEGNLDESVFEGCPDNLQITYYDPPYTVRFHKNDGSDDVTAEQEIEPGVTTRLTSLAKLGWAKRGFDFLGWGKYPNSKVVWKQNWASVTDLAASGETVDLYAIWAVASDSYVIEYIRNDGAGTWRWVGFKHGVKTRMPSLANGLKWARRGYAFKGWELTTANANDNTRAAPWKGDWAYVSTPVAKGGMLTAYARWALKPGYYQIRFNRNDDSGKWRTLGFECGKGTKLSTISALGWERDGYEFVGWASSKANADAGKLWKPDGAWVTNAAAEGKTLSIYAIWREK